MPEVSGCFLPCHTLPSGAGTRSRPWRLKSFLKKATMWWTFRPLSPLWANPPSTSCLGLPPLQLGVRTRAGEAATTCGRCTLLVLCRPESCPSRKVRCARADLVADAEPCWFVPHCTEAFIYSGNLRAPSASFVSRHTPRVPIWSSVIGCCFYCLAMINKLGRGILEY